jgi:hypothetical protein
LSSLVLGEHLHSTWKLGDPAVESVLHHVLLGTCVGLRDRLQLQCRALDIVGEQVAVAVGIHRPLESIALPAEDVISVDTIPDIIAEGPDKWLRAIRGPQALVVERRGIPVRLVEDLWDRDWMARWTCVADWVGDVALVVGTVQVGAVPAGWEAHADHDSHFARAAWESALIAASSRAGCKTCVLELWGFLCCLLSCCPVGWVSNCHAKTGLESSDFAIGKIVDSLTTICSTVPEWVGQGINALVSSVPCLEVHDSRPVVGEVFSWYTAGAGGEVGNVGTHGGVEGISSDDLVKMRASYHARIDNAVQELYVKRVHLILSGGCLRV